MRRLLLLRHAKTERAAPGERDRERKLTARGRADAPVIGAYIARHRLVPDLARVSPAVRASETWTLVAASLAEAPRLVTDERIYNAGPETLLGLIRETLDAPVLLPSATIPACTISRCS
jgi:phosphohistidine phosphatase